MEFVDMGAILIDGRKESFDLPEGASIQHAFEVARDHVLANQRVVVEVCVGEQVLVWQDGSPIWDKPFIHDVILELHTDTALRLSLSLLAQMKSTLKQLSNLHSIAASALREGNEEDGIARTMEAMPWWQEMAQAISNVFELHAIDLNTAEWSELQNTVTPAMDQLAAQLGEFREAAHMRDLVLLADLHEYELVPATEQWLELCEMVANTLRQRFSTEGEEQP